MQFFICGPGAALPGAQMIVQGMIEMPWSRALPAEIPGEASAARKQLTGLKEIDEWWGQEEKKWFSRVCSRLGLSLLCSCRCGRALPLVPGFDLPLPDPSELQPCCRLCLPGGPCNASCLSTI